MKTCIVNENSMESFNPIKSTVMKTNCIIALITLFSMAACQKDEIMTWNNRGAICFETTDTLRFTFAYMENPESAVVEFPMLLSGYVSDKAREVNVQVISPARNPESRYEIISSCLEAGCDTAYLRVRVYCTPNLLQQRDTITFGIRDSEDLLAGDKARLTHSLTIYNRIEQPSWWDKVSLGSSPQDYLGTFTETKMQILYELFGTTDYYPFDFDKLMELYPDDFSIEYTYRVDRFKNYVSENFPELTWGPYYDYL